jgi:uncharacterized integral membrane protein (TIGR00697 family)
MINENTFLNKDIETSPKYLWFLTLFYVMVGVFANWYDSRLVQVFSFDTDAGTLIFPLTFLLSDLITEVYGFKHARRAIWCGFMFNILFVLYGQLVIHMPSPTYPTNNKVFDALLSTNFRIILASSISYLISEPFNSFVMAKLKIETNGKFLGIRFLASTFFAACIDSFIFSIIAFYGVMSNINLFHLILTMWLIKVVIEIIGLPFSIRLTKKLKVIEKMDLYDRKTKFDLFSLDANYSDNENEFTKRKKDA